MSFCLTAPVCVAMDTHSCSHYHGLLHNWMTPSSSSVFWIVWYQSRTEPGPEKHWLRREGSGSDILEGGRGGQEGFCLNRRHLWVESGDCGVP